MKHSDGHGAPENFFWENSWENINPHFFFTAPIKFNWHRNEMIKSESRYFEFMDSEKKHTHGTISRGNKRILSILWRGTSKLFPTNRDFPVKLPSIRKQVNVFRTKKSDVLGGGSLLFFKGKNGARLHSAMSKFWVLLFTSLASGYVIYGRRITMVEIWNMKYPTF